MLNSKLSIAILSFIAMIYGSPMPAYALPAAHAMEQHQRIDLNKADIKALMKLPSIGKTRAKAIVAYRVSHGAFKTIDDLRHVKGVNKRILAKIRDFVRAES